MLWKSCMIWIWMDLILPCFLRGHDKAVALYCWFVWPCSLFLSARSGAQISLLCDWRERSWRKRRSIAMFMAAPCMLMIFVSCIFDLSAHQNKNKFYCTRMGVEKPVQYWVNNRAHHARWKAIWTLSWPWTTAQALWSRFHGFKSCRQGTYQTLLYFFQLALAPG